MKQEEAGLMGPFALACLFSLPELAYSACLSLRMVKVAARSICWNNRKVRMTKQEEPLLDRLAYSACLSLLIQPLSRITCRKIGVGLTKLL